MGLPERQLKDVWLGLLYTGGRVGCVGRTAKSLAGVREVGWRRDAGWIDVLFS